MVTTSGSSGSSGRIAVDAMGGDLGPSEVVAGVKLALQSDAALPAITLVGDRAILEPLLAHAGIAGDARVSVFHASEVVTMDDKPLNALKKKKDSSMVRAIELVKNGDAGALVSCGNTGALTACGTIRLRMREGVARAALGAIIPREGGHFILVDAGANPEAEAENLVHNAILGSQYCRFRLGVKNPRVGLITIGTEEGKGNAVVAQTNDLLRRVGSVINYVGPIEGFQVFTDHVDVVVCDGFVGNILLKSWESLAKFFKATLSEEMKRSIPRKAGYMLAKGAFTALKERINPDRYGGAPLLGLNGNILKAHGSSNRHALRSAILAAGEMMSADLNHRIEADIARANELLAQPALS